MNSPWTTTHEQLSDDEKASSGVTEVSTEQGGGDSQCLGFLANKYFAIRISSESQLALNTLTISLPTLSSLSKLLKQLQLPARLATLRP